MTQANALSRQTFRLVLPALIWVFCLSGQNLFASTLTHEDQQPVFALVVVSLESESCDVTRNATLPDEVSLDAADLDQEDSPSEGSATGMLGPSTYSLTAFPVHRSSRVVSQRFQAKDSQAWFCSFLE